MNKADCNASLYLLNAALLFTHCIHMFFIAVGHPEFTSPVSLAILWTTLIVSPAQAFVAARASRGK
jgi:hypothetical protein